MNKVKEFIKQHTKLHSNEIGVDAAEEKPLYYPWLSPSDAKEIAKIAREEVIEEIITFLRHDHRMFIFDGIDLQNLIDDLYREVR